LNDEILKHYLNLCKYFEDTYLVIKNGFNEGAVLVCCATGLNDAPTIVIALLIKMLRMNLFVAHSFIVHRHHILIDPYVMMELMGYETKILGTVSYMDYMDDYAVEFIILNHGISPFKFDEIKKEYLKMGRNIYRTIEKVQ